jgi:hypothetical protein
MIVTYRSIEIRIDLSCLVFSRTQRFRDKLALRKPLNPIPRMKYIAHQLVMLYYHSAGNFTRST